MDLTPFYATVSAFGFTLLGLWWVVADRHREWFRDPSQARMAYVVSLHFMIPATMSVLSLVASDSSAVWRVVFALLGASGIVGTLMLGSQVMRTRATLATSMVVVALPVYLLVVLVAFAPSVSDAVSLRPLQLEAFLVTAVLLLGIHAAWFFTHVESEES